MTQGNSDQPTESLRAESDPAKIARRHHESRSAARPDSIGPYKILEELGEGGMGVVFLAEQERPIHRRVALKIIKLGMDTKQVIARFETEREALALMNHPNVAKVFDAGVSEQGRPYFVMEHVPGIPITDYCDKHRLTTGERLHLFMDVCNAVQHAHQKGIIHRDIKPSNVLVAIDSSSPGGGDSTPPLGKGGLGGVHVKVIDFGVAKATQHRLTEKTLFTEQGQLIGTPGYMSPEQAEMTALDIDTRTDIYSLGVLLYELLVGARPFDEKFLREAGLAEIQRIIRNVDPPKPSTKLIALQSEPGAQATGQAEPRPSGSGHEKSIEAESPLPHGRGSAPSRASQIATIAHNRHTEPKTLLRQIRGDLDWIVMKCLEKDRTRRYDTASGLAQELQRYLNNEPVLAGPPTSIYRLKKFIRRNPAQLTATVAVMLALIAGAISTSWMYFRTREDARVARLEMDSARLELDFAVRERKIAQEMTNILAGQNATSLDNSDVLALHYVVESVLKWLPNAKLEAAPRDNVSLVISDLCQFAKPILPIEPRLAERIYRRAMTMHHPARGRWGDFALRFVAHDLAEAEALYGKSVDPPERPLGELYTLISRNNPGVLMWVPQGSVDAEIRFVDFATAESVLFESLMYLYDNWNAAEPGKGYAEKAAEWRGKLEETSKRQNVETSKP